MHHGHDHDFPGHANVVAGISRNHRLPQGLQWQRPHLAHEDISAEPAAQKETDLDLVEKVFSEGFANTSDPTSFLRLALVPSEAVTSDGKRLVLLRVETDAVADVGAITPHLGGETFRYDPLPAKKGCHPRR